MKKMIALSMIAMLSVAGMAFHGAESRCSSCHIVHMATDNEGVPLWNGDQTVDYDEFTAYYEGFRMDATVATGPEGSTLLCLSCHDGSSSKHAMVPAGTSDMSGSHPIEFVYNSALVSLDNELKDPDTASSGVVGSDGKIADDLLTPGHVLNCMSCHDIHAQGLHGQTTTVYDDTTQSDVIMTFDMPHLINIPGIEWTYNSHSGLDETDKLAYRLEYQALCVACHIK